MSQLEHGRTEYMPTRRSFLQVGYSGLVGLGLPGLLAARAAAATTPSTGRARSVIVILLSGGLGQHDSFDMKPEAPEGMQGRVQADRHGGARHPDVRALTWPGGAGWQVGDRPLDVASRGKPPGGCSSRVDRPSLEPSRGE